jgi:hypothetical protein
LRRMMTRCVKASSSPCGALSRTKRSQ